MRVRSLFLALLLLITGAVGLAIPRADAACDPNAPMTRITRAFDGGDANDASWAPFVSANGRYVTYSSAASNLVSGGTSSESNVFLYDRQSCTTELISISTGGGSGNGPSFTSVVSSSGRFVAFFSRASDLVTGDTNAVGEFFLRDRQTGTTTRLAPPGIQPIAETYFIELDISDDGSIVMFSSEENFLPETADEHTKIYLYHTSTGEFTIASRKPDGSRIECCVLDPNLSHNGRYLAFTTGMTVITPDTNRYADIHVRDLQTGEVWRISDTINVGIEANGSSSNPQVDDAGRFVFFATSATNLMGDTMPRLLRDRVLGDYTYVAGQASQDRASISFDGGVVIYASAPDVMARVDILAYLRISNSFVRVSVGPGGTDANSHSVDPSASADGRVIAFTSYATNLVAGEADTNNQTDIYVAFPSNVQSPTLTPTLTPSVTPTQTYTPSPTITPGGPTLTPTPTFTRTPTGTPPPSLCSFNPHEVTIQRVSLATDGTQQDQGTEYSVVTSDDGRYIAFSSRAGNLVPGDTNGVIDVFVYDRLTCQIERVSVNSAGVQGNQQSYIVDLSRNGRYVAFHSWAGNLAPNDTNGINDLFVHDRQTGATVRVTRSADNNISGSSQQGLTRGTFSGDNRYLAFFNSHAFLSPQDTQGGVFVYDLQTNTLSRRNFPVPASPHLMIGVTFSADLEYGAFVTGAPLAPGETDDIWDVYLYHFDSATLTKVSKAPDGSAADGDSGRQGNVSVLDFSEDGRYLVYASSASNIAPEGNGSYYDIFLYNRTDQTNRLINRTDGGIFGNRSSFAPSITDDGRYIAFLSESTNLHHDDTPFYDIHVFDQVSNRLYQISRRTDGSPSYGISTEGEISDDGQWVAFSSYASDLIPGDTNTVADTFTTRWSQIPQVRSGDNLITHGGFEDASPDAPPGDMTQSWLEYGRTQAGFYSPICIVSLCGNGSGTAGEHQGGWWAWLGGWDSPFTENTIGQGVRIPTGQAILSAYLWLGTNQAASSQFTLVIPEDNLTLPLPRPLFTYAGGYQQAAWNLTALADGDIHSIFFDFDTTSGLTSLNIDTIALIYETPAVPQVSLIGYAAWQGRPTAASASRAVPITIQIQNAVGGTPLIDTTVTTSSVGTFILPALPAGTYRLRAKGAHTLSSVQTITLAPGMGVLTITPLREGDVNDDNVVNLSDFSILATSFGRAAGTAGFDARADLNHDGVVNISDFSLLAANFGQSGVN